MSGGRFVPVGISDDEIVALIPSETDVLGVTCAFSEEWPLVRRVIEALRRALPDVPIVAGVSTSAPQPSSVCAIARPSTTVFTIRLKRIEKKVELDTMKGNMRAAVAAGR